MLIFFKINENEEDAERCLSDWREMLTQDAVPPQAHCLTSLGINFLIFQVRELYQIIPSEQLSIFQYPPLSIKSDPKHFSISYLIILNLPATRGLCAGEFSRTFLGKCPTPLICSETTKYSFCNSQNYDHHHVLCTYITVLQFFKKTKHD